MAVHDGTTIVLRRYPFTLAILLCYCVHLALCQSGSGTSGHRGRSGVSTGWIVGVVIAIIAIIFGLVCLIIGICYCTHAMRGQEFSLCPSRSGSQKYTEPQTELHLHDGLEISHPTAIDTTRVSTYHISGSEVPRPYETAHDLDTRLQSYASPPIDDDARQVPCVLNPEIYHQDMQAEQDLPYRRAESVSSDGDDDPLHDTTRVTCDDDTFDDVSGGRPPYSLRESDRPTSSGSVSEDIPRTDTDDPSVVRNSWTLFATDCFERGDFVPTSHKPDGLYSIGEGVSLDELTI